MKKLSLLVLTLLVFVLKPYGQLVDEDFSSFSTGPMTTTPSTITSYQIVNDCSNYIWEVSTTSSFEHGVCSACSGNRATIDEGASGCQQENSLITKQFSPNVVPSISISFDYSFKAFLGGSYLKVFLYNETDAAQVGPDLVYESANNVDNGVYSAITTLSGSNSINDNYSLRFYFSANYDYGAQFDNVLVQENCGPVVNFTQDCSNVTDYNVSVDVTSLSGGSSVTITDGATTYHANVGIGTYNVPNLINSSTIYVVNDLGCTSSQNFGICDPCNSPSAPADEPCNAPSVDLSQPFYGSTACGYTVSSGGNGPDAFGTGCGAAANNDSWLQFTAADDSVILDWEVYNCTNSNGVQFAVFSGNCNNQDGMVLLECNGQANGTGTFIVENLTIGSSYFIYIDGYGGDQCDYNWTPQGGVAITPPNDTIGNAILVECGDSDTSNNILATNVDAPASCGGLTPGTGVWYKYIGDGSDVTVSTDNPGTNFDTQIFVYSGAPGSLSCIGSDNDSGTGITSEFTFTANTGTDYYIYIDGNGTSIGQIEMNISCVSCNANAGNWN
jgi:hypothetical protein